MEPSHAIEIHEAVMKACRRCGVDPGLAAKIASDLVTEIELVPVNYGTIHKVVARLMHVAFIDVEGVTGEIFTELGGKTG